MSQQAPGRRNPRTYTVVGLFALFIVAVVAVLLGRLFPGRLSRPLERIVRRNRIR
jgi:hypothetical protein